MITCVQCEVRRSQLWTIAQLIKGRDKQSIAEHLTDRYGTLYYVNADGQVYRVSNERPYADYRIWPPQLT